MPAPYLENATFGVEFECYMPDGSTQAACAAAVSQRLGKPCIPETYNHRVRDHWKIVVDGSLQDYRNGIEVVAPKLSGEEGLREIEKVADALSDFGCTVRRLCGFHVHVGSTVDSPLTYYKNLLKLYGAYEPVIDAMMPASRRASSSHWARSMTAANQRVIERATSVDSLIESYHARHLNPSERRYYKLNLEAHARHKTVEFRQHSGTLSAKKAVNWTIFCLKLCAAAKRDNLPLGNGSAANVNQARPGSKAYQIGQMMMRPEGVTGREVCAAMGWPSVSMPQQAALCGLQFTTQRTGREVRYYAVTSIAAAPQLEISIAGLANLIGANDAEREYLTQRTNDLRGPVAWAA